VPAVEGPGLRVPGHLWGIEPPYGHLPGESWSGLGHGRCARGAFSAYFAKNRPPVDSRVPTLRSGFADGADAGPAVGESGTRVRDADARLPGDQGHGGFPGHQSGQRPMPRLDLTGGGSRRPARHRGAEVDRTRGRGHIRDLLPGTSCAGHDKDSGRRETELGLSLRPL